MINLNNIINLFVRELYEKLIKSFNYYSIIFNLILNLLFGIKYFLSSIITRLYLDI